MPTPFSSAAPPVSPWSMLAHHLVEAGVARRVLVVGRREPTDRPEPRFSDPDAGAGRPPGVRGAARRRRFPRTTRWSRRATCTTTASRGELPDRPCRCAPRRPASGAHFREPITVAESWRRGRSPTPLKFSTAAPSRTAARPSSWARAAPARVRLWARPRRTLHQHVSAAPRLTLSARRVGCAARARGRHRVRRRLRGDLRQLHHHARDPAGGDRFRPARRGRRWRPPAGSVGRAPAAEHPRRPVSYGHCGVAGAMAHLAEAYSR